MVEERMMRALAEFSANKKLRIAASARQKLKMEQQQAEEKRMLADAGFSLEDVGEEDEVLSQDQLQTGELQTAASAV
jgi:ATP-dependent RNA helicase SUPV3L1/SUV3